jgi:hypothetical protein
MINIINRLYLLLIELIVWSGHVFYSNFLIDVTLKAKAMKVFLTFLFTISITISVQSQSIKNSIDGSDFWGAWMLKGTSMTWLVDGIPERARLWDYEKNEVLVSVELKPYAKDINMLADGSLAYVSHNAKNEYIILGKDGISVAKKFNQNAPTYYIHPDGNYFFGSTFEGFFTYTIKGNKITQSKLNESITGYSSKFYETNSPDVFFRSAKDVYQKIEIDEEGRLISTRALDKNLFLLNEAKDEILLISPSLIRYYGLPDMQVKSSVIRKEPVDLKSGVYNAKESVLYYSYEGKIYKMDLNEQKILSSNTIEAEDLYFEDRIENKAIAFSDSQRKIYVIQL